MVPGQIPDEHLENNEDRAPIHATDQTLRGGVQRPFTLEAPKRQTPDAKRRNPHLFTLTIP
jgi:hypothetical protein